MQRCSKPIQTSRIATTYNVLLLGEVRRAVLWTCKPVVGAWKGSEGSVASDSEKLAKPVPPDTGGIGVQCLGNIQTFLQQTMPC
eukprot:1154358-Pelagomonas_calceolata.AAC.6